jgi:hypothetical protein
MSHGTVSNGSRWNSSQALALLGDHAVDAEAPGVGVDARRRPGGQHGEPGFRVLARGQAIGELVRGSVPALKTAGDESAHGAAIIPADRRVEA